MRKIMEVCDVERFGWCSYEVECLTSCKNCCPDNCPHLTKVGCGLSREERPVLCRLYLCPSAQRELIENGRINQVLNAKGEYSRLVDILFFPWHPEYDPKKIRKVYVEE